MAPVKPWERHARLPMISDCRLHHLQEFKSPGIDLLSARWDSICYAPVLFGGFDVVERAGEQAVPLSLATLGALVVASRIGEVDA